VIAAAAPGPVTGGPGSLLACLAGHLMDRLAGSRLLSCWLLRNASRARGPRLPHDRLTCPFLLERPTRRFLRTPDSASAAILSSSSGIAISDQRRLPGLR